MALAKKGPTMLGMRLVDDGGEQHGWDLGPQQDRRLWSQATQAGPLSTAVSLSELQK